MPNMPTTPTRPPRPSPPRPAAPRPQHLASLAGRAAEGELEGEADVHELCLQGGWDRVDRVDDAMLERASELVRL
eukprot:9441124-Pyramimonas_sp.AAC.1